MLRTIVAGLRARTARLVLSSVAIALGVALVTGTLVLGDAIKASVADEFARDARNVDVAVDPNTSHSATERAGLTPAMLDTVRRVPGVAAADGRQSVAVPLVHAGGRAKPALGVAVASDPRLRPYDLVSGRDPERPDEVTVDQRTAAADHIPLGGQLTLLDRRNTPHRFTVVGTYQQGTSRSEAFLADQVVLLPSVLPTLGEGHGYEQIVAVAAPGVDQAQLAARVRSALGAAGVTVRTGAELTQQRLRSVAESAGSFSTFLLVFALVALVVAAMVIYNTFTILLAQRTREIALMRCVGASRPQVFRSVLAEAIAMGLAASGLGLLGGLGLSAALQRAVGALGGTATTVRLPLSGSTVIVGFAVGVLVTVLSAVVPALRATRVPPVTALRALPEGHDEVMRTSRKRIAFVLLLALAGSGLAALGLVAGRDTGMLLTGAGTVALLGAVVAAGPLIVGPINRLLGVIPGALFGVPARLASANATRNPRRTAATTAALMIGVTIVTMITVVANSGKQTVNAEIDKQFPADFTVTSAISDRALPASLVDDLRRTGELRLVAPEYRGYATLDRPGTAGATPGDTFSISGVGTDSLGELLRPTVVAGRLDRLGGDEIALRDTAAREAGLHVGDRVSVRVADLAEDERVDPGRGPATTLRVVAIYHGSGPLASALVDAAAYTRMQPNVAGFDRILVRLRDGVSAANGRDAVERATRAVPIAEIDSAAQTKEELNSEVNKVLALVWALIGLAVVIALFGIANTLTLSVIERTRESALLRALGLTRGQLRLMLLVESVLLGVAGAGLGMLLGSGFAWLLDRSLSTKDEVITFAVPFDQVGVMLLTAVVAAVLAAVLPARRAARTSVVAAMVDA
ncbi:ABC transporter permease [Gandjariella thermophila]|uniref:ABC transporter substrate-binding protein n=1 Tax=Gandjariella thermophila TaxID=1931992 RepID=A0A4D4J8V6_9PSEU|nr:FtsX-like permease family protein [Gandjariella thermophila]GDY31964.1 ABC transporter substrate-binding protein [Gandjariella thermophila]